MLPGLLEGHGLGFTLPTAASQKLDSRGELLGVGQVVLLDKSHSLRALPGSSLAELRDVPALRLQRRGVDGASLEDPVYHVLPRLLVLVPQQRVHKRV